MDIPRKVVKAAPFSSATTNLMTMLSDVENQEIIVSEATMKLRDEKMKLLYEVLKYPDLAVRVVRLNTHGLRRALRNA